MNRLRVSGLADRDLDDIWYEIAKEVRQHRYRKHSC